MQLPKKSLDEFFLKGLQEAHDEAAARGEPDTGDDEWGHDDGWGHCDGDEHVLGMALPLQPAETSAGAGVGSSLKPAEKTVVVPLPSQPAET